MDEASIAHLRTALGRHAEHQDGIWPEHVAIVQAFLAVSTQWRIASVSGGMAPGRVFYAGLDYAAAQAGLQLARITLTEEQWIGVRIMESEARTALNEANSR